MTEKRKETVRVTVPEDAIEEMKQHFPLALNEPEMLRFYMNLGLIHARATMGGHTAGMAAGPPSMGASSEDAESSD